MTIRNKIGCIFTKICWISVVLMSLAYIPLNVYWHSQNSELGFELSYGNVAFSIIFMSIFFFIGWMFLLKTNNPITRYNPFSINPKWDGKMKGSLEDNPGQMFEVDSPDENEVRELIEIKR